MTKEKIKAAMEAAGLILPKVIPFLKRDSTKTYDLYAGPYGATKHVRVRADCDDGELTAAFEALR
jgi:hypothetical protein